MFSYYFNDPSSTALLHTDRLYVNFHKVERWRLGVNLGPTDYPDRCLGGLLCVRSNHGV
jgi:hypothetical protein